jgi:ketosteroid isomerase-like protein
MMAAALAASCKAPAPEAGDVAGVQDAIKALRAAVNSRDSVAFFELTAPDFEVFPPGVEPLRGDSAREAFAGLFAAAQANLDPFSKEEISVSGDLAIQRYSFRLVVTPKGGRAPSTAAGSGLHIWRRDPQGHWRLAKDIWSEPAAHAS